MSLGVLKMIRRYREIENSYIENFAQKEDRGEHIIFWDEKLPDMYAFNCIFIKEGIDESSIEEFVLDKLSEALLEKRDFLKVILHPSIEITSSLKEKLINLGFEVNANLYMKIDGNKHNSFAGNKECVVKEAKIAEEFEQGQKLDLEASIDLGMPPDFSYRKTMRKKEIYKDTDRKLFLYLCYYQNIAVGKCELFISEDYAKIEDFDVLTLHRGKGLGTAMLKKMISDALKSGINNIYLIAAKEDTPRQMYSKLGFNIIGEETELFWSSEVK
jgi:spore maturation protein CgeE